MSKNKRHRAERIYDRGELWVECSCGHTVTCSRGSEFGHEGHAHTDDCLPLICPGSEAFPRRVIPPADGGTHE